MKAAATKKQSRPQLIEQTAQAYLDLFVTMQSNAVSHWLMMELSFAQARALIILASQKELTVSQMARALGVGNSTASILIQGLVERGLITRREAAADRRQTLISLSEEGQRIGAGRIQERKGQWQRWMTRLSDGDLEALSRGLTALGKVAREEQK